MCRFTAPHHRHTKPQVPAPTTWPYAIGVIVVVSSIAIIIDCAVVVVPTRSMGNQQNSVQ